jgi:formylglycine-generating enzyme required for sulfatase activity
MWSVGRTGTKRRKATWKKPGFEQSPMHPVVGVSWHDAKAFCGWLTEPKHGLGALPAGAHYRLPTDKEWSIAVGLSSEPEKTPRRKRQQDKDFSVG